MLLHFLAKGIDWNAVDGSDWKAHMSTKCIVYTWTKHIVTPCNIPAIRQSPSSKYDCGSHSKLIQVQTFSHLCKLWSRGQLILFSHWPWAFHLVSFKRNHEYEMSSFSFVASVRPFKHAHQKILTTSQSERSLGAWKGALRCCVISYINQHLMFN